MGAATRTSLAILLTCSPRNPSRPGCFRARGGLAVPRCLAPTAPGAYPAYVGDIVGYVAGRETTPLAHDNWDQFILVNNPDRRTIFPMVNSENFDRATYTERAGLRYVSFLFTQPTAEFHPKSHKSEEELKRGAGSKDRLSSGRRPMQMPYALSQAHFHWRAKP